MPPPLAPGRVGARTLGVRVANDAVRHGQIVILGALLIALIPIKRRCTVGAKVLLATDPETAWRTLVDIGPVTAETRNLHPALPPRLLTWTPAIGGDPSLWVGTYDASGRGVGAPIEITSRILESDRPHRQVSRVERVVRLGTEMPTASSTTETTLRPVEGGTEICTVTSFTSRNLAHYLLARWRAAGTYARAVAFFRDGKVGPAQRAVPPTLLALGSTALTVGSFSVGFGWYVGLALVALIVLHELGHWGAMRIVGQKRPRIALIPFFGGVAMPSEPYRSRFAEAFCVLMGPGLSALICAALIAGYKLYTPQLLVNEVVLGDAGGGSEALGRVMLAVASMIALLNLFQLLPVLPFDGGRLLHTMLQAHSAVPTRWLLGGLSTVALALALWTGQWALALLAVIGLAQLRAAVPPFVSDVRPMGGWELASIMAGTAGVAAILCVPLVDGGWLESLAHDLSELAGSATVPRAGSQGSTEDAPRFTVSSALLAGVPETTWVSGDARDSTGREWRFFGTGGDPGANAAIKVADQSVREGRKVTAETLPRDAIRLFEDSGGDEDAIAGKVELLATPSGDFGLVHLTANAGEVQRSCLGFEGFLQSGRRLVTGYYCSPAGHEAAASDVACLVEAIEWPGEKQPAVPCPAAAP